MRPFFLRHDIADVSTSNAKLSPQRGECLTIRVARSHLSNLLRCEFGKWTALSEAVSSLLPHVGHVVSMGAFDDVLGIDADGSVAGVHSECAINNRPSNFLGEYQPRHHLPLSVEPDARVTLLVRDAGPVKAAIRSWLRFGQRELGRVFVLGSVARCRSGLAKVVVVARITEALGFVPAVWMASWLRRHAPQFYQVEA